MHANLRIGEATVLMSDDCLSHPRFQRFSLAIIAASVAEAQRTYAALAEGGTATMPPTETFWSPCYGMLVDKFGVHWMAMAC